MRVRKSLSLLLVITMVSFSNTTVLFASHGGGGGGCSGDCTPPTLGIDAQGKTRVEGGLTINSESFNVEYYSQDIPTQVFKIGEKNKISLKIYDNTGPEFLSHVEIHFGVYDKRIEGITVEDSIASIVWDDTGGDEIFAIYGDKDMFKEVIINQEIKENIVEIAFNMKAAKVLEESTVMVKIWDENRNQAKNYFHNAIKIINSSDPSQKIDNNFEDEMGKSSIEPKEGNKIPEWIRQTAGWWSEKKLMTLTFF